MPKIPEEYAVNVLSYFEREFQNGGPLIDVSQVRLRVAEALKISLSKVNQIAAARNRGLVPSSPKKRKVQEKPVVNIDDFTECSIKNVIYSMYQNKEHLTLTILRAKLEERKILTCGRTSLNKILHNIGFQFKKDDPKRGLMEQTHIAIKRTKFLRQYMQIKKEGTYDFIFLDETWIFKNGSIGRSWQDNDIRSVKTTKEGGPRFIILHASGNDGWIEGAELIFASKTINEDYHSEMNHETFEKWFKEALLSNLKKPSCIVMDNARYHSVQINKAPTKAKTISEIQDWLKKE